MKQSCDTAGSNTNLCKSDENAEDTVPTESAFSQVPHQETRAINAAGVILPRQNGMRYAGRHLLVDLIEGCRLDEVDFVRQVMLECVEIIGATRIFDYFFPFPLTGGVSGVIVLAESHVSIHSWPEISFATVDFFVCGQVKPELALELLKEKFQPTNLVVAECFRGLGALA